jgi:transposase-like protein
MARVEIRRLRGRAREAHAREVLARYEASGLGQASFARREGVSPVTLGRWREEFGARAGTAGVPGGFIEVRLAGRASAGGFEVGLADGRVVRVPVGFDAQELARLLAALEPARC